MWWQIGAAANLVIGIAYLFIAGAIVTPLIRSGQIRSNPLGLATAAIFFTCAVHHGFHGVHMTLPALGVADPAGIAMRQAFHPPMVIWDLTGAGVALWYWSLRSTYGSLMRGAALFEDMKERQRQALQINDDIVQGLTVAKMALELDQREKTDEALQHSLDSASRIITELLGKTGTEVRLGAGDLVRKVPAVPSADLTG